MHLSEITPSHILIVDDVVDNLNMLADFLEEHGHDVRIAMSGQAALNSINEKQPDLVLLDIQMPGMDGYEVCERIKADEETRDIPVIFLSAHTETNDILRGFDVGGVDYVGKPFQFREVVARVQSQLSLAHQRREIQMLRERDRQQFQQISEMRERFMQASVHDLKNPLTGVLLYSGMLKSFEEDQLDELPDIAEGIENSARKMQRLITDILDLAQMQIGERMMLIPTKIQPMLEKCVLGLQVQAGEKSISLHLEVPDDSVTLNVHPYQFERVLDNLVSNAIKYTSNGGQVYICLKSHDDHATISIRDTGYGIPEDDIPHLFEAFYRVKHKDHKKQSGSGLGLSIVDAIIEQHHGDILVESQLCIGSNFIVRLPLE